MGSFCRGAREGGVNGRRGEGAKRWVRFVFSTKGHQGTEEREGPRMTRMGANGRHGVLRAVAAGEVFRAGRVLQKGLTGLGLRCGRGRKMTKNPVQSVSFLVPERSRGAGERWERENDE